MKKGLRWLLALCLSAVAGVFILQFYWIDSYYKVNKQIFEREVNLAFEDALKKEFSLRCDTIQQLIVQRLMDTTEFTIKSTYEPLKKRYVYTIVNQHKHSDVFSFTPHNTHKPLLADDTAFKRQLANDLAKNLRSEDLEHHIVYYRTQNLGAFMLTKAEEFSFDTLRLRPLFNAYLAERDIHVPYQFHLRETDSTFNRSRFNAALLKLYPVITQALPTYKFTGGQQYIRAMFRNPAPYILSQMQLMFAGSILLLLIVSFSLFYLFRSLMTEKKLSAIKNDFISNITHEFKTPIASVSAVIESFTSFDVLNDTEKTQRYLTHSQTELKRLSALVDKVLNTATHENSRFSITPEPIELNSIITALLDNYTGHTTKQVSGTFINTTPVTAIYADRLYFEHALNNILDNAVKYSGASVTIEITCRMEANFLVIAIKDNGIGIHKNELPLIFEKFYRVISPHHAVKGHGLGLSYVKSIMDKHRGWCRAESEPGKGSTLTLAWPL